MNSLTMSDERMDLIITETANLDKKSQEYIMELINEIERLKEVIANVADIC